VIPLLPFLRCEKRGKREGILYYLLWDRKREEGLVGVRDLDGVPPAKEREGEKGGGREQVQSFWRRETA